jgi:DNA-binding MarR family transcriptional regulator
MAMQCSVKSRRTAPAPLTNGRIDPPWHLIPTAAARRLHQICVAKSSAVLGEFGLTPLQFGAMVHLNRATGSPGIEQNGLAARLNIDRNTASVLVEQLASSGVVTRQVDGADRRVRLLSLSPKGEKLYGELLPAFAATNAAILAPLHLRERKQFMDLLIRVIEGNLGDEKLPSRSSKARRRPIART